MLKCRYMFLASMVVGCSSASHKKPATDPTSPAPSTSNPGNGTNGGTSSGTVNGALPTQLLPAGHAFYTDVSAMSVHPQSATYLASIGLSQTLHPNFSASLAKLERLWLFRRCRPGTLKVMPELGRRRRRTCLSVKTAKCTIDEVHQNNLMVSSSDVSI